MDVRELDRWRQQLLLLAQRRARLRPGPGAADRSQPRNLGSFVSCRYDQWRSQSGQELVDSRQAYWRLAASLHQRFAYVLTYLYNAEHHNHIHVDNSRSGSGPSTFRPTSRVQVQAVQALCTYLWAVPVELTGRWDTATRRASRTVLDRIGTSGDLDAGSGWSTFLTASAGRR